MGINILRFGQESTSKRKILFEGSPVLKAGSCHTMEYINMFQKEIL